MPGNRYWLRFHPEEKLEEEESDFRELKRKRERERERERRGLSAMYSLRRSLVLPRARQGALHAPRRDRTTAASAYPHSLSSSTILSRCQRGRGEEKGEEEVTRRGESVVCFAKKKKKKSKAEKRKESKFSSLTKQKAEAESKIVKHETTEVILDLLMLVENYSQKFNKVSSWKCHTWLEDFPAPLSFVSLRSSN